MSEAKFTKGPWKFTVSRNGVRQISSVISSQICKMWNFKETTANAHLIASAPDMYEMLKQLSEMSSEDAKIYLEYSSGITDLLSKARGENA